MVVFSMRNCVLITKNLAAMMLSCLFIFSIEVAASAETANVVIAYETVANGSGVNNDYLDHTVLKVNTEFGGTNHYILFTKLRSQFRGLGKITGFDFITKLYRIDSGERLTPIKDEVEARRVFSQGEYVHTLPRTPYTVSNPNCDFLRSRFWPFEQRASEGPDWYFIRLSKSPFWIPWQNSSSCANLGGEPKILSNVSARVPAIYHINSMTLLVDYEFPFAIIVNENSKGCVRYSLSQGDEEKDSVMYLLGDAPLPNLLNSDVTTRVNVNSFIGALNSNFHQLWDQLSSNCKVVRDETTSSFEHLDNTRPYVKLE
jgi:hypothetical protein